MFVLFSHCHMFALNAVIILMVLFRHERPVSCHMSGVYSSVPLVSLLTRASFVLPFSRHDLRVLFWIGFANSHLDKS